MSTIAVSESVKATLDLLKQHHRQSYNEVLVAILSKIKIKSDSEPENTQSDSEGGEKKGNEIYKDFGQAAELWQQTD